MKLIMIRTYSSDLTQSIRDLRTEEMDIRSVKHLYRIEVWARYLCLSPVTGVFPD